MKKILSLFLTIMLVVVLFVVLADNGGAVLFGFLDLEKLADTVLDVVATAAITAIGVGGTWLTVQIGKNKKFERIGMAVWQVTELAKQTVAELKQTVADGLKAANADGKLTEQEVYRLRTALVDKTKDKLASAAYELLTASAVDVEALILGAGEELIGKINAEGAKPEVKKK